VSELLERVLELRAKGDYQGAREAALEADNDFGVLLELGRLEQDLGDHKAAEATFVRAALATTEDGLRSRALARLASAYLAQERLEEARSAAQEALELAGAESPATASALIEHAYVQLAVDENGAAEESLRRALELAEKAAPGLERDRLRTRGRSGLGRALRAQGRNEDAEPVFREVVELSKTAFGGESVETEEALRDLRE
jgi:tetratricopeptide (TPR) repeat protein